MTWNQRCLLAIAREKQEIEKRYGIRIEKTHKGDQFGTRFKIKKESGIIYGSETQDGSYFKVEWKGWGSLEEIERDEQGPMIWINGKRIQDYK